MNKTILVVDDELGIRELLKDCLEDEGYNIVLAESASEADKILKEELNIDLILLDVWLPDMDGVSLLKRWQSNDINKPIIMMSGHTSLSSALECLRIGAKDFIEKPLSLNKLLPLINSCFMDRKKISKSNTIDIILPEFITLNLNDSLRILKENLERSYFLYQIEKQKGNITRIAEAANVDRAHLYRKFKNLGIQIVK